MRLSKTLIMMVALLLAQHASAAPKNSAADRTWKPFIDSFRSAVKRRDREALRRMMSRDFYFLSSGGDDNGDRDTRDETFEYWDGARVGAWESLEKVLAQGTVPNKTLREPGNRRPGRVAPPAADSRSARERGEVEWYAVFEFRRGRWYATAFAQCCD